MITVVPVRDGIDRHAAGFEGGGHVVFAHGAECLSDDAFDIITTSLEGAPELVLAYANESWEGTRTRLPERSWKPVWSPERLRGQDYVGLPVVVSKQLLRLIGGLEHVAPGPLELSDLILRASERADAVIRIPEVLHHTPTPRNWFDDADDGALLARQSLVQDHLDRVGVRGRARTVTAWQTDIDRELVSRPVVSLIIPTCGTVKRVWGADLLLVENCIRSVLERSTYGDVEFVVVYDDHTPDLALDRLRALAPDQLTLVPYVGEFNFSEKVNLGAVRSKGDVLLLLNDDTQVVSPDWIEVLLGYLAESDVGIVGPLLLLADSRIQSAGHFFVAGANHAAAGAWHDELGPERELAVGAERSGVTMACAAIRREVFEAVGGLSVLFPRAYNDVDFCNKLVTHGYRVIWTPRARLYHFESLSRDPVVTRSELDRQASRWGQLVTSEDGFLPQFDRRLARIGDIVAPRSVRTGGPRTDVDATDRRG